MTKSLEPVCRQVRLFSPKILCTAPQIATFSPMDYIQFEQGKKKIFLCDMRPAKGARFSQIVEKGVAKVLRSGKRVVIIAPKK